MNYNKAYPSTKLAPYIKHYWGIKTTFEGSTPYFHRIIPTGLPELIFYIGYKPNTSSLRRFEDNGILNIQQNDYYDLIISDSLDIFSIYFQPEAVNLFFDLPLGQFFNRGVALSQLNTKFVYGLQERLCNTESFDERVNVTENFLIEILNKTSESIDFRRMQHIVHLTSRSKGIISIDKLIEESCLGRKQFERKFINQLGISPKQYLKIIRFQSSLYEYSICPTKRLTELAYNNGYYDQSHFINDIKAFTGESPKKIFSEGDVISDYFDI